MNIAENVFEKMSPDVPLLQKYGFRAAKGGYAYSEEFMGGAFRAEVFVSQTLRVSARVLDVYAGGEYAAVNSDAYAGAYVGAVRAAFESVLRKIAAACFKKSLFSSPQGNRIAALLLGKYGDAPDFPFSRPSVAGVFRCPQNRKWYALIMRVKKSALFKDSPAGETADIMNLKIGGAAPAGQGFLPAYHMNRKNWITVLLDAGVSDGEIMGLLDESRRLACTKPRATRAPRGGGASWIVPANPLFFDIDAALKKSKTVLWKQSSRVEPKDIVYMYVAAPVSAVRYKCEVVEADIPYSYSGGHVKIKRVMKLRLLKTYKPSFLPFAGLKKLGITAVRGPRLATPAFLRKVGRAI